MARAEIATASTAAVGDQGRVVRPIQVNRRKLRKQSQAKGADSLVPKWYVARSGGCNVPRRRWSATGVKAGPNPRGFLRCNAVSPSTSREGRPAARRADGAAGKGRGRKRRPARNGSDRS